MSIHEQNVYKYGDLMPHSNLTDCRLTTEPHSTESTVTRMCTAPPSAKFSMDTHSTIYQNHLWDINIVFQMKMATLRKFMSLARSGDLKTLLCL